MLATSLMAAPLLWLGIHKLVVYNIVLLSGFALSGAGMFLLARALTKHTGAALVAGFVFAFLPYRFLHYAHLELLMTHWMPLCLWALHRTLDSGRYRDGLMTGLFIALQTLSSVYYGIFLVTYLIPVGAVLVLGARRARLWPIARSLAAGAALAAMLVSPMVRPYLTARQVVGERSGEEIYFYSASPRNYLAAPRENAAFGERTAQWGGPERRLFQGIAVPILAAASLWPPVSAARLGYATGLLVAFNVSLGIKGKGYERVRRYVLPYRGLRVPARMSVLVGFSLAVLVAYALARVCRALKTTRARAALLLGVSAVVFAEYRSTPLLMTVWREPPPVYAALAGKPAAVLVELPLIEPDVAVEPSFMYFSTFHWHRLVNGYSGFLPPSYRALPAIMSGFPDDVSVAEVRRRGADYVVVHGAFQSPTQYAEVVERLQRRSDFVLEHTTVWQERETRLYRIVK
jgi:hypothetical protein